MLDADLEGANGPERSRLAHEAGEPGILRQAVSPPRFLFYESASWETSWIQIQEVKKVEIKPVTVIKTELER